MAGHCEMPPPSPLLYVHSVASDFYSINNSAGLVRHPMSRIGRCVGDNAEIFFDNVRVPKGRILPPPPKGRTYLGTVVTIAAVTLGLGRATLEEA